MHIQRSISDWNIFVLSGNEQTQEAKGLFDPGERNQTGDTGRAAYPEWMYVTTHARQY